MICVIEEYNLFFVVKEQENGNGENLYGHVCKINLKYHLLECFSHYLPINSV